MLSSLTLLAGCATTAALPDRARAAGGAPGRILEIFARDHDGWKTIKANVSGNSEKGSFSGALFVDRDRRRFRLYAWKLAGAIPIFDLLVENDEMRLLVPRTRKIFVGSPNDLSLEAFLSSLFKPRVPVVREAAPIADGYLITESRAGRQVATYRLAARSLALESQTVPDRAAFITYSEPIVTDGRVWPTAMTVQRANEKPFTLKFDDIVFDAPLDEKKFVMRVPPGTMRVSTLKELGDE